MSFIRGTFRLIYVIYKDGQSSLNYLYIIYIITVGFIQGMICVGITFIQLFT